MSLTRSDARGSAPGGRVHELDRGLILGLGDELVTGEERWEQFRRTLLDPASERLGNLPFVSTFVETGRE